MARSDNKSSATALVHETDKAMAVRQNPKGISFAELSKTLYDAGDAVSIAEYGSGFKLLDKNEKGRLVGVPFWILDYTVNDGDFGEFVSLQIVTQSDEQLILNDGSTGIAKQIRALAEKGETRAIYVKKGLRRSDYEYTDSAGAKKPATTFYLDDSE